jgi:hypothetical protein
MNKEGKCGALGPCQCCLLEPHTPCRKMWWEVNLKGGLSLCHVGFLPDVCCWVCHRNYCWQIFPGPESLGFGCPFSLGPQGSHTPFLTRPELVLRAAPNAELWGHYCRNIFASNQISQGQDTVSVHSLRSLLMSRNDRRIVICFYGLLFLKCVTSSLGYFAY